jgi:hypothetical protein
MMSGGVVPAGSCRSCVWDTAVTWAMAIERLTCGWKKSFTTATPCKEFDSMWSMLSTVVVSARSVMVTIRSAICSGDRPWYCQMMLTTGMSIFGKISTGVCRMDSGPMISSRSANTAKVYGRRSASRTIHIGFESFL